MSKKAAINKQSTRIPALIGYYETCNRSEGRSPKTISWYTANLRQFHRYLQARHLSDEIADIDVQLLREYVLYLLKKNKYAHHPCTPERPEPISAATVHGHVRTLRAFFSWLAREALTEDNIGKGLKPPKVPRKVVSVLSDEEIGAIMRTLNPAAPCDARNQTMFMILLDTGLRIHELISLKMDDAHLDEGFLKVMGKGQKERIVPIGNNAQRALQRYLFRFRPEAAHLGIENVFLSGSGLPLTENGVKLMFARLARRSGVTRLHAHLCRHTFATRFLMNGGDVFSLQRILGHSTLEMVGRYVNLASSHVAVQHRRFSPLDRMSMSKG